MQLNEEFDADAILREPFDCDEPLEESEDEEIPELKMGDPKRINDLDIPDEEEGDADSYGL